MACHPRRGSRHRGMGGCCCGCGCGHSFRRFYSSEEELESLATYRDELKKELAAVEEEIKEQRGK